MAKAEHALIYYEVYVLEQDRWTLQMRYRREEKDYALAEAKALERSLNTRIKVIRETYYPENNASDEMTIYLTSRQSAVEPAAPGEIPPASFRRASAPTKSFKRSRYEPPKPPKRSLGLILAFKVVGIVVAGILVALFAAGLISTGLAQLGRWGVSVGSADYSMILFLIFAGTFLLTAIPLAFMLINNAEDIEALTGWKKGAERKWSDHRPAHRPPEARSRFPSSFGAPPSEKPAWPPVDESPPPAPVPPPIDSPSPVLAAMAPIADAELPEAPPPPSTAALQAPDMERRRMTVLRFLNGAVGFLKKERPQLDRYNIFGLDLMLAGAIEMLGEQQRSEADSNFTLLREAIEILGSSTATADAFCDQYDQYLREPRYLQMVQAGRDAMAEFLQDAADPYMAMKAAVERWNRPTSPAASARIITVIFTDMVGSTNLTQTLGEMTAQDALRRHNNIVRSALTEFDGREIKHTGDGIMASFASAANAVDAAVAIQRAAAQQNAASPDLTPLHLRIGMNTGEPIEEEDDLFGTTVQMAARACAAAEPDSIWCTNVVRELSGGRGRCFLSKGTFTLKGFPDPIPLYEVLADAVEE